MNQRIRALAEQVKVIMDGDDDLEFYTEKFAELIIRECVDIADEYDGVGSTIVGRIKKHFGVAE